MPELTLNGLLSQSDMITKEYERLSGRWNAPMERTSLSGSNGKITGADLIDDYWFPEIKRNGSGNRHDWTDGVLKFWNNLVPLAKGEGKKPMAIVHAGGTKLDDSIVMIVETPEEGIIPQKKVKK